jgi:molybdopterin-containing oxidoreductase family iron-sulfur binding subunit
MADHRLRIAQRDVPRVARVLAAELVTLGVGGPLASLVGLLRRLPGALDTDGLDLEWIRVAAADLVKNMGQSVVVPASSLPAEIHALTHAMNYSLGNFGKTVGFGPIIDDDDEPSLRSISALAEEIDEVQTLFILGGNPVYDAPADLSFSELLAREGLTSIHLGDRRDETAMASSWHVPLAHELEAWGDQQSHDGSLTVQQPLIAPLYGARSAVELLATVAGLDSSAYQLVKETQREALTSTVGALALYGFPPDSLSEDSIWRGALHSGALATPQEHTPDYFLTERVAEGLAIPFAVETKTSPLGKDNLEVNFEPDPALWDGDYANNLWALELPHPMTKLVWDNAAVTSPTTAKALGVEPGQMIRLSKGERSIDIPVWTLPGHADFCFTLTLGWGRTAAGRYGNGKGFDVNPLRTTDGFDHADGVTAEPLRESYQLVQTQTHGRMEGRPLAIDATLDEYKAEPNFASYRSVSPVSTPPLWKQQDYSDGHKWGMVIDLSACTGCNACVIACQAENNIPVVGKFEVERGREMHWLRIDRYFVGDDENEPDVAVQPVTCQQCEEAPCENVCPVNATVHSPEGLNDMVYNRCVGTRYCANNCPYKVRRFNYLDWHGHLDDKYGWYKDFPESRKLQFNPNVTVRMRGVMEKCTYCVQRIQEGKIAAKREDRELKDGDIKSACQQACPSRAISFGDLNDPDSLVSKWSKSNRGYQLLAELGTRPRTSFLARIRNPNPSLKGRG